MRLTEATFRCRVCRKIMKSKKWTLECDDCNRQMVVVPNGFNS